MERIGITNNGDPAIDFSWVKRLQPKLNIIVTRDLRNPQFQQHLLQNSSRIILHCVCSGWGATPWEPKVPHPGYQYGALKLLIANGFPRERIVLRVDPIIPTEVGLRVVELILDSFTNLGIKRCRIQLLKLTRNVRSRPRFTLATVMGGDPYTDGISFFTGPSRTQLLKVADTLRKFSSVYTFESCKQDDQLSLGCISFRDLQLTNTQIELVQNPQPKFGCKCPANKIELISRPPEVCEYECVWCSLAESGTYKKWNK